MRFESFSYYVHATLGFFRHDMPQGLANIPKWWRFIWTWRNYDYGFLVEGIDLMLCQMQRAHEEDEVVCDSWACAMQIATARKYLKWAASEEKHPVIIRLRKEHEQRWGSIVSSIEQSGRLSWTYSRVVTPEEEEQAGDADIAIHMKEREIQQRCWKKFAHLLITNIEKWWI